MLDDDYDERNAMGDEAKAFERVGLTGRLSEFMESSVAIGAGAMGKRKLSPKDRFLESLDGISRKLSDEGFAMTETDRNIMLEKASETINIHYKNPTAFIMGYLASKGGREMNVKHVKKILEEFQPHSKQFGVDPPDIIRYARFWMNYL